MGLFKQLVNAFCTNYNFYISPLTGSDSNSGSILNPIATLTKLSSMGPSLSALINGKVSENATLVYGTILIGDSESSELSGSINFGTNGSVPCVAFGLKFNVVNCLSVTLYKCTIKLLTGNGFYTDNMSFGARYCFIENYKANAYGKNSNTWSNNTILNLYNIQNNTLWNKIYNSIIINSIDLYNFSSLNTTMYPIFQYCLFRKLTVWKWNGATIAINWTNNPVGNAAYTIETLLERVYNSLLYYANTIVIVQDKTYAQAILATITTMFFADTNGQTNKVVDDVAFPIFNMYNGTAPIDYSLKLDPNNVALTMSDTGSYVGAYKANLGGYSFGSILNVNTDGTDDAVTTPTLLVSGGLNQFSANDTSLQLRNRIRTTVVQFPRGKQLSGAGSQLTSGLPSRLYFGKRRPMITSGGGLTVPVESFEVIPYDSIPIDNSVGAVNNISGKSIFPRFSVSFNGATQMWYKANGQPLLFNDLANYSITTDVSLTEYGTWAVTSADAEDYNLSLIATANSLTKKNIPVNFCKQELNLNFIP